jgi:hypothetical protein
VGETSSASAAAMGLRRAHDGQSRLRSGVGDEPIFVFIAQHRDFVGDSHHKMAIFVDEDGGSRGGRVMRCSDGQRT